MSPIPTIARRGTAYPYNGWDMSPPSQPSLAQRNTKDISDKNIDEEVYGFVRDDKNMSPIPTIARRGTAYPYNGWDMSPPSSPSLSQRDRKDISDKNIDEEVYGFVRADKNMSPIPTIARRGTPYPYNGWDNSPPSQPSLMQRKNISQPGVEPNVYDFVHDKVEVLNWPRRDTAYPPNGWDRKDALAQIRGQDIADKEVRPDVYVAVKKNVSPAANWRSDKPPTKGLFEPYVGVQEPYPAPTKKEK